MNISAAAERSGVPPKTIRYYEEIGLVRPLREDNGYRSFQDSDVHKLTFLGKARALGFGIDDCRALLALWEDEARASAEVKRIAKDICPKSTPRSRDCLPCVQRWLNLSSIAAATADRIARS